MNYPIEFVSAIIFFSGLIVVYNLRAIFVDEHKTSFNYMTSGLATMSLCSLASVLAEQSALTSIPFLNIPLFFQLCYWIGMITGLTLLMSGVSSWLPVYKKSLKYNADNFHKIELFKKIEQLTRFENRNSVILLQAIELILNQYDFLEVGCFLYSQKNKKMILLGAVEKRTNKKAIKSKFIHFCNGAISDSVDSKNIELPYITESHTDLPSLMLPMQINNKLLGAICCYSENNIDELSITNLKLIINILSKKIYNDSIETQNKYLMNQNELLSRLDCRIDLTKAVKENIVIIKNIIQSNFSVDFLTISFPFQGKNRKYTVSENNQVLEEVTTEFVQNIELENYVFETNIPVVINNLDIETDFIVDIRTLKNNIKSILAYPLRNMNGQLGVMIIGSKSYNAFNNLDCIAIEKMQSKFGVLVLNSIQNMNEITNSNRSKSIKQLLLSPTTISKAHTTYQHLSDFIAREIEASIVRISIFDKDERFLNSQVMTTKDQSTFVTPADASMMLMIMPSHRKVLQQKETTIVQSTKDKSEISLLEQRQVYGEALSLMVITPFYDQNEVVGVITIGFSDTKVVLSNKDIEFIEEVASVITDNNNSNKQTTVNKIVSKQELRYNSRLHTKMKNNAIKDPVQRLLNTFEEELVKG